MNNKSKILQMLALLAAIVIIAGGLLRVMQNNNSMSLSDYERLNTSQNPAESSEEITESQNGTENAENSSEPSTIADGQKENISDSSDGMTENLQNSGENSISLLTGASLNGISQTRVTYSEGFYYEEISDNLRRYITGISYPAEENPEPEISVDELRYVHIWHYDFDGNPAEGELICNEYIAQDLVEIFYELYRNEYQLEKVLLIEEYDGDDTASMEDNNTSCFHYRTLEESTRLSRHAYGLAVDINPFYNPYVTYESDGTEKISPAAAECYADRSVGFAYKIDENDLCYKLFTQHGFTWGGNWNNSKDYQHFQKSMP